MAFTEHQIEKQIEKRCKHPGGQARHSIPRKNAMARLRAACLKEDAVLQDDVQVVAFHNSSGLVVVLTWILHDELETYFASAPSWCGVVRGFRAQSFFTPSFPIRFNSLFARSGLSHGLTQPASIPTVSHDAPKCRCGEAPATEPYVDLNIEPRDKAYLEYLDNSLMDLEALQARLRDSGMEEVD